MKEIIEVSVLKILNVSGKEVIVLKRERALKNLLAKMIGELYYPDSQPTTFDEADIPTRHTVLQYMPKIIKIILSK